MANLDTHSNLSPTHGPSFGYHCSAGSTGIDLKSDLPQTNKIARIANVMRKVAFVALVTLGVVTAMGLVSTVGLIIAAAGFVGTSAFYYSSEYRNYKQICETAGIVFQNAEQVKKFEVTGIQGKCEAIPTEHCADTELWRADLIQAAEHNIVLSGNYCGGKSFAKLLDLVEKQIIEKPNLKVVIISSPNFIKNGNLTKIEAFSKKYPNNFSLVESPDIWHVSTGLKKSTNHTKCMVIDYGKYFILGGSGVKDNFAETGLDHLTKEEFLKQKEAEYKAAEELKTKSQPSLDNVVVSNVDQQSEIDGSLDDLQHRVSQQAMVSKTKTAESLENTNAEDGFFLKNLIPGNFRDMDFVFRCQGGKSPSGKQVYKQMLLLCYRWEQYNKMLQDKVEDKLNVSNLGVFTGLPTDVDAEDSVVVQLLKTPIPKWESIKTRVPHFDESTKKCSDAAFQIFASGPEHNTSKFAEELADRINNAKDQIVINHMYFHPTTPIMNALIEAAKRGVKIKIITSGVYKDCPASHLAFGPRNKYNYAYLVRSLPKDKRGNVEVYEFQQKKKGNHKKVIVIDDHVIAGSSNLGYKSLHTTSDHELNFFAKSQQFADETMKICDLDIKYSQKVHDMTSLSIRDYMKAAMHRVLAPLIG